MKNYILVIDEGTTGTRAILFDRDLEKSLKFLEKPLYCIFLKAVSLRNLASGISGYIYRKYKLNK